MITFIQFIYFHRFLSQLNQTVVKKKRGCVLIIRLVYI